MGGVDGTFFFNYMCVDEENHHIRLEETKGSTQNTKRVSEPGE